MNWGLGGTEELTPAGTLYPSNSAPASGTTLGRRPATPNDKLIYPVSRGPGA